MRKIILICLLLISFGLSGCRGKLIEDDTLDVIFYIGSDAEGPSKIDDIAKGSVITKPANPTKRGFIFAGWYGSYIDSTSEGKEQFDFSKPISSSITVYAKWYQTFPVLYFDGEAALGIDTIYGPYSIFKDLLDSPTKDGFTFVGWYLDEEFANSVAEFEGLIKESINLYAKFE